MTQNNKSNSEPNGDIVSLLQTIANNTKKEDTPFKDFVDSANKFKDAVSSFRDFARSFFSEQQQKAFDNVHLSNIADAVHIDTTSLYTARQAAKANGGQEDEADQLAMRLHEIKNSDNGEFNTLQKLLGKNINLINDDGSIPKDFLQQLQDGLQGKDNAAQEKIFNLLKVGMADGLRAGLTNFKDGHSISQQQEAFVHNAPKSEELESAHNFLFTSAQASSAADKVRQDEFNLVSDYLQALEEAFIKLEATHPDILASDVVALSLALMGLNAATIASTGITLFGKRKCFKAFLRGKKGAGLAEEALEEGAEELFEGKEKAPASKKTTSKAKKADAKPAKPAKPEAEPKGETKPAKAPAEAAKNAPKAPNTSTNVASKTAQVAEKAEEELKAAEKTGGNLAKKAAATGIKKRGGWSILRVLGNVAKSPATRHVLINTVKTGGSFVGRGIAADGLLTVLGGTAGAGTIAELGLGALLAPELALPIAAGAATYGAWKWWNNRQAEHAKQEEAAKKAAEINLNAPPLLPGMQASPQNVAEFYRQAEKGQNEKAQIAAQKNAFFQKSMLLEKERALGPLTEIRTGDIIINDAHTDDPLAFAHEVETVITQALNRTSNIFNPNIAI